MKTFKVTHIEDYNDGADHYYKGDIIADNLDKAVQEFKNEWLEEDYNRDNITVVDSFEDMETLEIQTDWFKDGEQLTDKEIEELEKEHDMDISDMFDNFDLGFEISYLTHLYKIEEIDA